MHSLIKLGMVSFVLAACTSNKSTSTTGTSSAPVVGEAPLAVAGSGGSGTTDQPVVLDGSGSSDPDGDEILFKNPNIYLLMKHIDFEMLRPKHIMIFMKYVRAKK